VLDQVGDIEISICRTSIDDGVDVTVLEVNLAGAEGPLLAARIV